MFTYLQNCLTHRSSHWGRIIYMYTFYYFFQYI